MVTKPPTTEEETKPSTGTGAPPADKDAPVEEPKAERKLVAISKMGSQTFRMEWLDESGAQHTNHVNLTSLRQTIGNFEDIPPGLPEEDRRHRQNIVAEARFKLVQLPDENWEAKDLRAFAKRAGIEVPKESDPQTLLKAIYS